MATKGLCDHLCSSYGIALSQALFYGREERKWDINLTPIAFTNSDECEVMSDVQFRFDANVTPAGEEIDMENWPC